MNFGSYVLHIVVKSATDSQIERDDYYSESQLFFFFTFSCQVGSNVGGDRWKSRACQVFWLKDMLSRVEGKGCVLVFRAAGVFSSALAAGLSRQMGRQYLAMLLSLPVFLDRYIYRFVPYFRYVSS